MVSKDYVFALSGHPDAQVQPYVLMSAPAQATASAAHGSAVVSCSTPHVTSSCPLFFDVKLFVMTNTFLF